MATIEPIRIGVAGFGFWGTKLARNVAESPLTHLVAICDPQEERRQSAAWQYPGAVVVGDVSALVTRDDIDALIIATPEATHHATALAAVRHGKHVMVEKPMALSVVDCLELEREAAARGLTLMVGHTFLYSPPVRLLRELMACGELGEVLYCYSQRLNLGALRQDISAMWDLAPHDISIIMHLLGMPTMVSAQQLSLINEPVEDVAMISLAFQQGAAGHIHVSRLDPRKVRQFVIVGDLKMAVYDDLDADMPVKLYDKGVTAARTGIEALLADSGFARHHRELRSGDILAPKVTGREPLREEIEHFASCIATGQEPLTCARHGRAVVAVLEAAERSAVHGGEPMVVHDQPEHARTAA